MLQNPLSRRLLKKVQMQGGARRAERGVLRVRRSERPSAPTPQMGLFQQPARRMALVRWPAALVAGGILVAAPYALGIYPTFLLSLFCIFTLVTVGLNILVGLTGQISLGHVGFFAIGAYTAALLRTKLAVSYWLGLPLAGLGAAGIGFALGLPALKVRGHYLALVTLAFGEIVQEIIIQWKDVTNGIDGVHVPPPALFGMALAKGRGLYYVILGITAVLVWGARNLTNSASGRAFKAIRSAELAAQAMGVSLAGYKLLAFVISAFYAGVAGALYGPLLGFISGEYFGLIQSVMYLMMIVIGGLGSVAGAIIGAGVFTLLPELLRRFEDFQELVYGGLLLGFIVFVPHGLAGILGRLREAGAQWRRGMGTAPGASG